MPSGARHAGCNDLLTTTRITKLVSGFCHPTASTSALGPIRCLERSFCECRALGVQKVNPRRGPHCQDFRILCSCLSQVVLYWPRRTIISTWTIFRQNLGSRCPSRIGSNANVSFLTCWLGVSSQLDSDLAVQVPETLLPSESA